MTSAVVPLGRVPIRRLFSVPIEDVRHMLWAQWEILAAHQALRKTAPGELVRPNGGAHRDVGVSHMERDGLTRIAVAVGRVARFGLTRPTCLVRAIAMERMIVRSGIDRAIVKIGVMQRDGRFHAHAWIEVDGVVVGDAAANVDRFVPLADFSGLDA